MSSSATNAASSAATADTIEVDLKDPRLAALFGWLVPGAGHLYQGRTAKGILFFVCILGTFIYGMVLGGSRVVYLSLPPQETRWAFFCQAGVGGAALPALIQGYRARRAPNAAPLFEAFRPPRDGRELHEWQLKLHRYFELGTVFTMVAGLLNILAVYDAYAGPLIIVPEEKEDKKKNKEKEESGDNVD